MVVRFMHPHQIVTDKRAKDIRLPNLRQTLAVVAPVAAPVENGAATERAPTKPHKIYLIVFGVTAKQHGCWKPNVVDQDQLPNPIVPIPTPILPYAKQAATQHPRVMANRQALM